MGDLAPCPFCAGSASIMRLGDHSRSTQYACDWCGCFLETAEEWGHGRGWNERHADVVRACDSMIVAIAAVAELAALPFVWQVLPMGIDFAAPTRTEDWPEMRVLKAPCDG